MDFKKLNPALNQGGKANSLGGNLSDSERISKQYTLDELTEGARQYKLVTKTLWDEIRLREGYIAAENKAIADLKRESEEISFGQLLTSAIGIKMRDEKAEG